MTDRGAVEWSPITRKEARRTGRWILRAETHGIALTVADFEFIDGYPHLDGMDPGEWLDAMLDD